eukprot:354864-Chlamydomonas_euryale.AAC.2
MSACARVSACVQLLAQLCPTACMSVYDYWHECVQLLVRLCTTACTTVHNCVFARHCGLHIWLNSHNWSLLGGFVPPSHGTGFVPPCHGTGFVPPSHDTGPKRS